MSNPSTIVFDVNETLSDMSPLAGRFADIGLPRELAGTWFASLLRDGFALTVTGVQPDFATVGRELLRGILGSLEVERPVADPVEHVMSAFTGLSMHPDVVPGLEQLREQGFDLVTLSNGSASVAQGLLERADAEHLLSRLLSVDDAGAWKPAEAAYRYAGEVCGVSPEAMMLVAVHPWDIHGAHRAGLQTAWIARSGQTYPAHFDAPDLVADDLADLAAQLEDRSAQRPD